MSLPNANNNITTLRNFHDNIESHVRGLLAMGQSTVRYGALCFPMVLGKLLPDVQKNLAREHSNLEWTLDQLWDSIVKEIRVLEVGSFVPPRKPEDHHSTTSFHTGATSRPKKGSHWSVYFARDHTQLSNVKPLQTSPNEKLCFNCLGHHRVSQCQSKHCCIRCKEQQEASLCQGTPNPQTPTTNSKSLKSSSEQPSAHSQTAVTAQHLINSTLSHPHPSKLCFMKSPIAMVRSGNHTKEVNILLDEGAQCSFITQSLVDCLHLYIEERECVAIAAFGASEASDQTLSFATVHLQTSEGTVIPISILITPRIAHPIL